VRDAKASDGHSVLEAIGLDLAWTFDDLPDEMGDVVWSADGTRLAAGGRYEIVVWSESGGSRLSRHSQGSLELRNAAWRPGALTLAFAAEQSVWLGDGEHAKPKNFCRLGESVLCLEWSPDGSQLAVADEGFGLSQWKADDGALLRRASVLGGHAYAMRWSPDGRALVTGSTENTILVHATDDLSVFHKLSGHNGSVLDVAVSPDSAYVASASMDHTVWIWELSTGKKKVVLEGHTMPALGVSFSPDGQFLASLGVDGMRLWRCRDWVCVSALSNSTGGVIHGLSFHPRRPLLAVKSIDLKRIDCYRVDFSLLRGEKRASDSRRYVNAKVVLLGDTGVGKSGLGLVLSGQVYRATDSTHGRNVCSSARRGQGVAGARGGGLPGEVCPLASADHPGHPCGARGPAQAAGLSEPLELGRHAPARP
jgi:WD40 repeat protein